MSARERILARVRAALEARDETAHPGAFEGWRPHRGEGEQTAAPVDDFADAFNAVGGEVAHVEGTAEAAAWLGALVQDHAGITVGHGVPEALLPQTTSRVPAHEAVVGISWGRGAVAETGTIILESGDGRRSQLLAPTHVVIVPGDTIHGTLADALASLRDDLPSAVGLHSGPSKSADIGQVMVRGVHGPGRIIALLLGPESGTP